MPISTTANYAHVGPVRITADVPNGGTLSIPYPTGTAQADYTGANAGLASENMVTVGADKFVGLVGFAFNASDITVTNNTGFTWSAAPRGVLLGPYPIHFGLPRANPPQVLNMGKALLPGPAAAPELYLPASGGAVTPFRGRPGV